MAVAVAAVPQAQPPVQEAAAVKLKMNMRPAPAGEPPSLPPPARVEKPSGVPFPVMAPPLAPGPANKAPPPAMPLPAGLTVSPVAMKGLPAIFVPADESGAAPPLAPLMSKAAQTNLGTRPPMVMNPRIAAAITGKTDGVPPPLPKAAKVPSAKQKKGPVILLTVLILGGAGFGIMYFLNPWGTAAAVGTVKEKIDAAAQLPGQAVEKAQTAMLDARTKEQARLDAAMRGEDIPDERGLKIPPPATPLTPEETAELTAGSGKPGSTSGRSSTLNQLDTTPLDTSAPEPSPRFVKWAQTLKVTGVFQGTPSRALIEDRLVRQDELIEPVLGVTFHGVDAVRKNVILQEESGAQVRLKY